jgi:predicted dehydrogenase
VFVRCASQFPFFPAAQRIARMLNDGAFGPIVELQTGLLHGSDLDPDKPINWKRTVAANGEYGVLGDLGMHACHLPLRAGWQPRSVRAVLSKIFTQRPDAHGQSVPCDTWDHATLLIETDDSAGSGRFPWTLRTSRIAAGSRNDGYIDVMGLRGAARYSTASPNRLELYEHTPGAAERGWCAVEVGSETTYPTITGRIFEFGFNDALLQMWAAFLSELLDGPTVAPPAARCLTMDEAVQAHAIFAAALESQRRGATVEIA